MPDRCQHCQEGRAWRLMPVPELEGRCYWLCARCALAKTLPPVETGNPTSPTGGRTHFPTLGDVENGDRWYFAHGWGQRGGSTVTKGRT